MPVGRAERGRSRPLPRSPRVCDPPFAEYLIIFPFSPFFRMNTKSPSSEFQQIDSTSGRFGFYDQWADIQSYESLPEYDRLAIRRRAELIADFINGHGNEHVLDIGCGEGVQLEVLENRGFHKLIGIDIALLRVKRAYKRAPISANAAGSAITLPFPKNYFDVVVCSEVIEHLPDVNAALSEMRRVVKPGGRIILSTPYDENIHYSVCIHCGKLTPNGGHLHSFEENGIKDLLQAAGFEVDLSKGLMFAIGLFTKASFRVWKSLQPILKLRYKRPKYLFAICRKPVNNFFYNDKS